MYIVLQSADPNLYRGTAGFYEKPKKNSRGKKDGNIYKIGFLNTLNGMNKLYVEINFRDGNKIISDGQEDGHFKSASINLIYFVEVLPIMEEDLNELRETQHIKQRSFSKITLETKQIKTTAISSKTSIVKWEGEGVIPTFLGKIYSFFFYRIFCNIVRN